MNMNIVMLAVIGTSSVLAESYDTSDYEVSEEFQPVER